MNRYIKLLAFSILGSALVACQTPSSEAQTLRERLQGRNSQPSVSGGERVEISVNGISRNFIVSAPSSTGTSRGAVIVFHGGGGSAERTFDGGNNLKDLALQQGFVAVFPNAVDGNWTDGRISTSGGPDDIAFVRAMIQTLNDRFGVDPNRVFATGISNGAIFNHKLACDAPGLIRAVAPVAGNIPQSLISSCSPSTGTPLMMFNGTEDPLMPFFGGRPEIDSMLRAIGRTAGEDQMVSSPDTAAFWAARNGCGSASDVTLPDVAGDSTTVTQTVYSCPAGTQVSIYRIDGGGHTWPGAEGRERRLTGAISRDIDASSTMLQFFRSYGL